MRKSSTTFFAICANSNINYTLCVNSSITIYAICVNLNINCVSNKRCYLFEGEIVKQFALFSDKFTQLFKNFTRPPVAAVAPNINSVYDEDNDENNEDDDEGK